MERKISLRLACLYCAVLSLFLVVWGCDDDDSSGLKIDPSSAAIGPGDSLRLEASGGNGDYSWSLSSENLGSLSTREGASVVYRSRYYESRVSGVQVVTVSSFVQDGRGPDASLVPATSEARITHLQDFPDVGLPVSSTTSTTIFTTTSTATSTSTSTSTTGGESPPTP